MKHVINGQIVSLNALAFSNEIIVNLTGGGRGTFAVTSAQIGAFTVPVTAMVAITIAAPEHETEPAEPPHVVIRGQVCCVGIEDTRHAFIDFLPDPLNENAAPPKAIRFYVSHAVVLEFGPTIGFPATITITPIG